MRKTTEVLRLHAAGMSARDIARSVGAARSTVGEYLRRADAAGLAWPLPEALDDEALFAVLFPKAEPATTRPVPDWRGVHKELRSRKHHVTLRLLWLEWRAVHPDGWGYSQYCEHYRRWLATKDVVMRLSYAPGERMFVDFSGDKPTWCDPETGELHEADVFVSVLGYSGMLYAEATRGQDLASWVGAHVHAWGAYGGVPEVTVPDNLKAGVTKASFYDPELNPTYAELAGHYQTVVLPTRTAKPRDKAAAEAGVLTVERWVLAPLRHRTFFSLAELNAAMAERVEEVNARAFRGEPTSRKDLFEELERPALRPLPTSRYELAEWKKVTVNIDYHVEGPDKKFYSVPHQLVRERLDLRASAATVEVFKGGRRVASHVREYGARRYVTDPAHMPASHRAHAEWTPSKLIEWGKGVSEGTGTFVEQLLASRPHPEHAYRACLGLKNLGRKYGEDRLGAACTRALSVGALSYTSVKSILAEGLDRQPLPGAEPAPPPPEHENLRGAAYWKEEA
ncbi:MAG TPA: IS21 family transposase [Acidimicrobiales bacterium]|jgi:transposase|nr:IS21 family transposase [Acidimicrobiales bacterium]